MVPTLRSRMKEESAIVDRFEASLPDLAERCGGARDPRGHPFVLLAHGDLWSNNVLFKMSSSCSISSAEDLRMLDLQECALSRPTADLACLLMTSLSPSLRELCTGQLLRFYHRHLVSGLARLGYDNDAEGLYPFERLRSDYRDSIGHGFYCGITNAWVSARDQTCMAGQ